MNYFDNPKNQYPEKNILNPPLHVKKEISIIIDILKKRKCKKIIDFGSGTGRLTIPLLKNNFMVTAIDISKESLKKLFYLSKKIIKSKYLKTLTKLSNQKYDAIVGTDIIHHIDIDKYFILFKKNLKKGGVIIFSEPNILNLSWFIFITLFLDWREEKRIIFCSTINLIKKLKQYQFKKIKFFYLGLFPPIFFNKFPLLAKMNYFLGNLPFLNLFAYRIIFQAEK